MPLHDWTRVSAGTFHDFHSSWIVHLKEALNDGLLPEDHYAQVPPQDALLSLGSYEARELPVAYIEPLAVGDELRDMPLFLAPGWYVNAPLEATYQAALHGVPAVWRRALESP